MNEAPYDESIARCGAPTFGGIKLEDIKAPECFIVERKLRARMKVPARGRCRAFHL